MPPPLRAPREAGRSPASSKPPPMLGVPATRLSGCAGAPPDADAATPRPCVSAPNACRGGVSEERGLLLLHDEGPSPYRLLGSTATHGGRRGVPAAPRSHAIGRCRRRPLARVKRGANRPTISRYCARPASSASPTESYSSGDTATSTPSAPTICHRQRPNFGSCRARRCMIA